MLGLSAGLGPPRVRLLVVSLGLFLGVLCPLLPCQFHLLCFLGASSDDKWCSAARVAETAMSGVVP